VDETAPSAAIRSGSLKCTDQLLKRKVKVDSGLVEPATACDHADALARLLHMCCYFRCSWMIAWLDGFRDGLRLLEEAGLPSMTICEAGEEVGAARRDFAQRCHPNYTGMWVLQPT
jgi:hypothetical protein